MSKFMPYVPVPINIIQPINQALNKYFFELGRQQYIDSFKQVTNDEEMREIADQGLGDYLDQLNELDAKP